MKQGDLKPLRVAAAGIFFGLTLFLFLDFRMGVERIAGKVLFLQFVPSMLTFMSRAALGAAGFILVLVLTLLAGRVYCSTVCPLGTLQDVIARLATANKRRRTFTYSRPHDLMRYGILVIKGILFLAGSGLLLTLLDPFSISGRIFTNLLKPMVIAANNVCAPILERAGIHILYRVQWPAPALTAVTVSLGMLVLTGILCARYGRLYCNTICPLGALLGLVSKIALFRITVDKDRCRVCGLCERVCKSSCIDMEKGHIDLSRCVVCCNCLSVCPDQVLRIDGRWQHGSGIGLTAAGKRRRWFLLTVPPGSLAMAAEAAGLTAEVIQSKPTTVPIPAVHPVSPPGSVSIGRFISICTACHLCVSACPSRVLAPSFLEYGINGLLQPKMNFKTGHCNYDCTTCLEICPTGAILPHDRQEKQRIQTGVAKFIKENCVVHTDSTNCGACSEHCPTKAVHMVPYRRTAEKQLVIPEVNPEICVGCGGCEYACPTRPYRAIYVDGNPVHKTAKKPEETKIDHPVDNQFPF